MCKYIVFLLVKGKRWHVILSLLTITVTVNFPQTVGALISTRLQSSCIHRNCQLVAAEARLSLASLLKATLRLPQRLTVAIPPVLTSGDLTLWLVTIVPSSRKQTSRLCMRIRASENKTQSLRCMSSCRRQLDRCPAPYPFQTRVQDNRGILKSSGAQSRLLCRQTRSVLWTSATLLIKSFLLVNQILPLFPERFQHHSQAVQ